ncbi:hypothetical protein ACO0K3_02985 [Undibacterium sp. Rencai35W]
MHDQSLPVDKVTVGHARAGWLLMFASGFTALALAAKSFFD